MMTDAQIGAALAPGDTPDVQGRLVAALGEKRAIYARLIEVGDEIDLWLAGVAPRPAGVIISHSRGRR
jgi:hypothetical protein